MRMLDAAVAQPMWFELHSCLLHLSPACISALLSTSIWSRSVCSQSEPGGMQREWKGQQGSSLSSDCSACSCFFLFPPITSILKLFDFNFPKSWVCGYVMCRCSFVMEGVVDKSIFRCNSFTSDHCFPLITHFSSSQLLSQGFFFLVS